MEALFYRGSTKCLLRLVELDKALEPNNADQNRWCPIICRVRRTRCLVVAVGGQRRHDDIDAGDNWVNVSHVIYRTCFSETAKGTRHATRHGAVRCKEGMRPHLPVMELAFTGTCRHAGR